jgi:hypothetical protein
MAVFPSKSIHACRIAGTRRERPDRMLITGARTRLYTRPVRASCAGTGPATLTHDRTPFPAPIGCH